MNQNDHMNHSFVYLSETMSHDVEGHPRRWVMVDSYDKTWSTGQANGKPFQHSCLENPMNSMKRQKDMILLEKSREITPEGMKRLNQSGNNAQLWMCLVMKVKSNVVKNNIA